MKHTWEAKDVKVGTYVQVGSTDSITGTYIIGYDPSQETPKKLRLISLCDGMIMGQSFSSVEKHVKQEHGKRD